MELYTAVCAPHPVPAVKATLTPSWAHALLSVMPVMLGVVGGLAASAPATPVLLVVHVPLTACTM